MYDEFERKLRGIRWKNNISNHTRWTESRSAVDDFYSKNTFSADILYNRLTTLKRKSETFKLIAIPVYITLLFGIFITLGINAISMLLDNRAQFLIETKDILDKALLTLTNESTQEATALYDKIVNETLVKHTLIIGIIAVCLVAIAVLLAYLLYPMYRLNNSKVVVYQYEIESIELLLKASESEGKNKSMKEIKYGDYICLGWNAAPEELQVSFLDYFKFLLETNFEGLENQLKELLGIKKFPRRSNEQLIEGIIATTPKELEKKRKDKNYYICNAICLFETIKRIFTKDLYDTLIKEGTPQIALHNYEHILRWMLIDSGELCNLYNNNMKSDFKYEANIAGRYTHHMPIHQILRQSLFGQVSAHSFADLEISASIAVIRQLIEIRIRRAFGAISYIDSQENLVPLDLSRIFEVVKRHKQEIEFPVAIENIERIYKWANIYIHSGLQELSWIPYFIETVLKELSFGKWEGDKWDVKNGISTTQSVIDAIYNELLNASTRDDLKIYSCKPELTLK